MSQTALDRFAGELVASFTPQLADDRDAREHVVSELRADTHGGTRKEWADVKGSLDGLARTASIRVQSYLAEALEKATRALEGHRRRGGTGWVGDMPVKMSNLPQHVQLLLNLAKRPTSITHELAYDYLHRLSSTDPTSEQVLYHEIMAEPFSGDHWGSGFDEEVQEGWTDSESDDEDEEVLTPSRKVLRIQRASTGFREPEEVEDHGEDRMRAALEVLREFARGAYWRDGGLYVERMQEGLQGWRQITTGTNAMSLALALDASSRQSRRKAISSQQLQRELLFALSGRPGIMFTFDPTGKCLVIADHPDVRQFSPTALEAILETFRTRSTQAATLRAFVAEALRPVASSSRTPPRYSRTKQAFAEECRAVLERFGHWVADLEASFSLGMTGSASSKTVPGVPAVTTPLLLKLELEAAFGRILEHLSELLPHVDSPMLLLNTVYSTLEAIRPSSKSEELKALIDIFMQSAAPLWSMLGDWINRGIPIPSSLTAVDDEYAQSQTDEERSLDPEFFIKRDRDVSWADEDFWEAGFIDGDGGWPIWLSQGDTREAVMECGKARGLLRGLVGSSGEAEDWPSLPEVLQAVQSVKPASSELVIAQAISSYLSPICQLIQYRLRRVLEEECGLQEHLDAIEGVTYMRGFVVLDGWSRWLTSQMQKKRRWADFHVLTGTLRDTMESEGEIWMNPAAVRLRMKGQTGSTSGPRALASIRAEYQVPFPLSQLFTATSMSLRVEVFAFLLQVQHARHTLAEATQLSSNGTKALSGLRHRLVWLINAVWVWLTERVIDLQIKKYRESLAGLTSLRAMIALELENTRQIRDFCFLHPKTSDLHESLMCILEMTGDLSDLFTAPARDAKVEAANRPEPVLVVVGRSRRRRRRRKDETSSDESDNEAEAGENVAGEVRAVDPTDTVSQMKGELDEHVRALRKGVEGLAEEGERGSGSGEQRGTWGMLALALEDWR